MSDLKTYDLIDVNPMRDYILNEGIKQSLRRGEKFIHIGEAAKKVAIVTEGYFAYTHPDYKGENQTISFAGKNDFLSTFISMPGQRSFYDIKSLCSSQIKVVEYADLMDYIKAEMPENALCQLFHAIAVGVLSRGISCRCDSPETRYLELLQRMPDILLKVPLKEIASYLGVTREHFSRMRTRMLK
ncbi:MAG: Crp/Fnr family transcriptional regulator [Bacteroides sp.]|nr:Crp/Fnr family transcriptional regulator [Bacteroides sp.]